MIRSRASRSPAGRASRSRAASKLSARAMRTRVPAEECSCRGRLFRRSENRTNVLSLRTLPMSEKVVAIAGGSGFIGRAIARRLAAMPDIRVRGMTRSPERARQRLNLPNLEWVRAEVTEPSTLPNALQGANAIVSAVQFEGYPVENPKKGLTFERIDLGGTVALIEAAKKVGAEQFVYISGAAADENATHPGFRAKGRA